MAGHGLRNPWRFSFDRVKGDLWIGDVGQSKREEIDPSRHLTGGLYNWLERLRGSELFETPPPWWILVERASTRTTRLLGHRLRLLQDSLPEAWGRYFYGDYARAASEPRPLRAR
jgi:hypothetical protein